MRRAFLVAALATLGCGPAQAPAHEPGSAPLASTPAGSTSAPAPAASPASTDSAPAPAVPKLRFLRDDLKAAMARAQREKKALFVDAWAPWCHTCLSMKHYVFVDPSLAPLAERMVFVALDTDRPENEQFVEKYAIDVWPTFFVLDPDGGEVIGFWPGAASVREIRELSEASLAVFDARRAGKSADPLLAGLVRARAAQAEGKYDRAANEYAALVKQAPADWSRRSEALAGWLTSLSRAGRVQECVTLGTRHLAEIGGAALPADFARTTFGCAGALKDPNKKRAGREAAIARMRQIVQSPSPEASIDDRADALDILATALDTIGDAAGARKAHEDRLALLEQAAKLAPSPQAASTFDYQRATAYVELGRPEAAVAMLQEREKQLPDSYEPPARLASVLAEMGRHRDALAAIDRALKHAYGPRRLRYLALKARLQQALGDRAGETATLESELAGWKELGNRAPPDRVKDAERRLESARRAAPKR